MPSTSGTMAPCVVTTIRSPSASSPTKTAASPRRGRTEPPDHLFRPASRIAPDALPADRPRPPVDPAAAAQGRAGDRPALDPGEPAPRGGAEGGDGRRRGREPGDHGDPQGGQGDGR